MTPTEIIILLALLAGIGVAAFILHIITVWREESAHLERMLRLHEKHAAQMQAADAGIRRKREQQQRGIRR